MAKKWLIAYHQSNVSISDDDYDDRYGDDDK